MANGERNAHPTRGSVVGHHRQAHPPQAVSQIHQEGVGAALALPGFHIQVATGGGEGEQIGQHA